MIFQANANNHCEHIINIEGTQSLYKSFYLLHQLCVNFVQHFFFALRLHLVMEKTNICENTKSYIDWYQGKADSGENDLFSQHHSGLLRWVHGSILWVMYETPRVFSNLLFIRVSKCLTALNQCVQHSSVEISKIPAPFARWFKRFFHVHILAICYEVLFL